MADKKTRTSQISRTEEGAKKSPPVANNKPIKNAKTQSFEQYQFNIKQISEFLGVSRAVLYQLEKNKTIIGHESRAGATTKKLYDWEDMERIVNAYKGKLKIPRPSEYKIKVFANLKGGVGKSSLSSQFAMHASMYGLKTLLIDLDPQAHATLALGITETEDRPTILNFMGAKSETKSDIMKAIIPVTPFLHLLPANLSLSTLDFKLANDNRRAERLRNVLEPLRKHFDLIVVDTNPSASLLNINALIAADEICVVCATDFLSVTGLKQLFEILNDLQDDFEDFGPNIRIIPNLFDVREAIGQESLGLLRQNYSAMLTNVVRKNVDLKEAQKNAQAVWLYNRKSPAAEDMIALTRELLAEGDK